MSKTNFQKKSSCERHLLVSIENKNVLRSCDDSKNVYIHVHQKTSDVIALSYTNLKNKTFAKKFRKTFFPFRTYILANFIRK